MFVVSAYRYLLKKESAFIVLSVPNTGRHFLIYKLMYTNNYVVNLPIQYIKTLLYTFIC